ncbi:MAG: hypothetical protein WC516_06725 [Patescibacteria group bacterium]|jgi:hypothetical protein
MLNFEIEDGDCVIREQIDFLLDLIDNKRNLFFDVGSRAYGVQTVESDFDLLIPSSDWFDVVDKWKDRQGVELNNCIFNFYKKNISAWNIEFKVYSFYMKIDEKTIDVLICFGVNNFRAWKMATKWMEELCSKDMHFKAMVRDNKQIRYRLFEQFVDSWLQVIGDDRNNCLYKM